MATGQMAPPPGFGPVMVLNAKTQRQTGRQAQLGNIAAARAVADIIRTTLGPRSMLKMLLDPMGGIVLTNDGNCILREVDVSHPTAKSMIELSRAQDEEVGDGTTSVIILAGEMLILAEPFIRANLHPTIIVRGYNTALQEALNICNDIAINVEVSSKHSTLLKQLVQSTIGTKFSSRWNDVMIDLALSAVLIVAKPKGGFTHTSGSGGSSSSSGSADAGGGGAAGLSEGGEQKNDNNNNNNTSKTASTMSKMEIDIKRYAKIEKIPGGEVSNCRVLNGIMFNKDVTHAKMRRRIVNPRILLLDCPLEYKKGETQTNVEITNEDDWNTMLRLEEEYVENMCAEIIAFQPDIVVTEKGVSDLAQHFFYKANITAFRRLRKSDNNRLARATGATIVSRTDEIQENDIGTQCGLFETRKIGDEYFAFFEECTNPKACTILLRGGSKDVLNEMERNLIDAMHVVRNVVYDPKLVPGGGATEMAVSMGLRKFGERIEGVQKLPFMAVGDAMEVIPRTLAYNCGVSVIRTVTQLRAKHAELYEEESSGDDAAGDKKKKKKCCYYGINGTTGDIVDMEELGIWEPLSVKVQTIKTAIESACMILRIDDIVSGSKKQS